MMRKSTKEKRKEAAREKSEEFVFKKSKASEESGAFINQAVRRLLVKVTDEYITQGERNSEVRSTGGGISFTELGENCIVKAVWRFTL